MLPATLENDLCCHHSPEPTFELQVENPSSVPTNSATSGGFLEAPGAPANGAPVYAPAPFGRNPGCRLRAVGSGAKSIAKHSLEWRVRLNRPKCLKLFAWSPTPGIGPATSAPVYAPCEVGPKPRLPSPRKRESVLPSTRRGGVWKKDAMSRVLGPVLEAPGALWAALKMLQHEPLQVLWEGTSSRIHAF